MLLQGLYKFFAMCLHGLYKVFDEVVYKVFYKVFTKCFTISVCNVFAICSTGFLQCVCKVFSQFSLQGVHKALTGLLQGHN